MPEQDALNRSKITSRALRVTCDAPRVLSTVMSFMDLPPARG